MDDLQRRNLIAAMGMDIAKIDTAIRAEDKPTASLAYLSFMAAAGLLAMEIDELDRTDSN